MRNQICLLISNVPVVQWQLRRCRRASRARGMLPAGWGSWFLLSARPAALISPGLSVWASHNQETAGRRRDSRCGWGWWWLSKFEQVNLNVSADVTTAEPCFAVVYLGPNQQPSWIFCAWVNEEYRLFIFHVLPHRRHRWSHDLVHFKA